MRPPIGYTIQGQEWDRTGIVKVTHYMPLICPTCHRKQPTRYHPPRCLFDDCPTNRLA